MYSVEAKAKLIKWMENEILEAEDSAIMYAENAEKNNGKYKVMYETYQKEKLAWAGEIKLLLECYK